MPYPPWSISGVLLDARHGNPLAGLRVAASYLEPSDDLTTGAAPREVLLGTDISDAAGGFAITFRQSPLVEELVCRLQTCANTSFRLHVHGSVGQSYQASEPIPGGPDPLFSMQLIRIAARPLAAEGRADVASRLRYAHLTRLRDLVAQLLDNSAPSSLFGDWDIETRFGALAALEHAFLDPRSVLRPSVALPGLRDLQDSKSLATLRQKLGSHLNQSPVADAFARLVAKAELFPSLSSVDWALDVPALAKGGPGASIAAVERNYRTCCPRRRLWSSSRPVSARASRSWTRSNSQPTRLRLISSPRSSWHPAGRVGDLASPDLRSPRGAHSQPANISPC
jgi:hypothetical protein